MYWFLGIVFSIIALIYGFFKYLSGNDGYWSKHGIVGLKSGDVITVWDRISFKYGLSDLDHLYYKNLKSKTKANGDKVGGIMEFRRPVLALMDPEMIKSVTVKDFDYFTNRRPFPVPKDDPVHFGKSLLLLENQEWKDMRSTLSPTFSTGKIRRMFGIFMDSAQQMTTYLKNQIEASGSADVELREICGRYTMNVIASSAFGIESNTFSDKNSVFYQMGHGFQNQFKGIKMLKIIVIFLFPRLAKLFGFSFLDPKISGFFGEVIKKTVKHRIESGQKREDFVQLLLDTRSEPPATANAVDEAQLDIFEKDAQLKNSKVSKVYLTDDLILAQSILFFLAGFDTTETLLIFAAYELALNPDVQDKLASEINEAVETHGKLTYEVVNSLEYLDMVINETLRKYPPAIRLERRCGKDYKLPGIDYTVKKDDLVMVPTYGMHYDEDLYPNPNKFDPTRFNAENKAKRNPYTYLPFGVGPRNCIAMRFALTEGKAAIAELVKSFEIAPTTKTLIPMQYSKSTGLKPTNGMWLKLTARSN